MILLALAAFYLVVRYGVIAREERYLERKFAGIWYDCSCARSPLAVEKPAVPATLPAAGLKPAVRMNRTRFLPD